MNTRVAAASEQPEDEREDLWLSDDIRDQRILVVDDHGANRQALREHLCSMDCRHGHIADGKTALEKLTAAAAEGDPFHIVIPDAQMMTMHAELLAQEIKRDPALRDTSLVLLSSSGRSGNAARLREVGFAALLVRPVERWLLYDCLIAVISNRDAAAHGEPQPIVTRDSLAQDRKGRLRILIAEDSETSQKTALHLPKRLGYQAHGVANGAGVLRALRKTPYDLVLIDVQMPEMDGLEATRLIRTPRSVVRNHNVPIIALTAHTMEGDRQRCLEAGMNDHIAKPVRPQQLLEVIERQVCGPAQEEEGSLDSEPSRDVDVADGSAGLARSSGDTDLTAKPSTNAWPQIEHRGRAVEAGDAHPARWRSSPPRRTGLALLPMDQVEQA